MVCAMDPDDRRRYVQVAAELAARIKRGDIATGASLPSTRDIKQEFGVSIQTAQKAQRLLETEGLVRKYPGLGYFVK